jgi:hypothetical protein
MVAVLYQLHGSTLSDMALVASAVVVDVVAQWSVAQG